MTEMVEVCIIIVNFKTKDLLCQCIESVIKFTKEVRYEIIVVDNGSNDGSIEALKNIFHDKSHIQYIQLNENTGFAKANNVAVKRSLSRYLFFLNPDTFLINNAVLHFYNFLESSPSEICAAGSNLKDQYGEPQISYGFFPSLREEFYYFGLNLFLFGKNKQPSGVASIDFNGPVDYISGADFFIRSSAMADVGLFDEKYFLYFEETDWCKRASAMGFKRYIISGPEIVHIRGASSDQYCTLKRLEIYHRSKRFFFRKHYGFTSSLVLRIITFGIYLKSSVATLNYQTFLFSFRQLFQ